jgi:soluble lytic murein transglycosylase-like protein
MTLLAVIMTILSLESSGNDKAVGDQGQAIGPLQIHPAYVADVNRIIGREVFTLEDRWDRTKSISMASVYLRHYSRAYTRRTGLPATGVVMARIHNGGPRGYAKTSTRAYARKFTTRSN